MSIEHLPELPPSNTLDRLLDDYAAIALNQEDIASRREARLAPLRLLQDVVWAEHCETVLPAREFAWLTVINGLRDVEPTDFYEGQGVLEGTWKLAALRKTGSTVLQLTTTANLRGPKSQAEELVQTKRYLERPLAGRKCPRELLGVQSEGRVHRSLPLDKLATVYNATRREELLDNTDELKASTVVASLGSSVKPRQLHNVDLYRRWHSPDNRNFYLEHENASSILAEGPCKIDQAQDPEAIIDFLRSRALGDKEWQKRYRDLAEIGTILSESSPL